MFPHFGSLLAVTLVSALFAVAPARGAPLRLEARSGPPTASEIAQVKRWTDAFQPDSSNAENAWAFGHSGQALEALGAMYELTHDRAFLDRMVTWASLALALRNDIAPAPVGQRTMWTGTVAPVWPNYAAGHPGERHCGAETADVAGRIAYCARLMMESPALRMETIPGGDPQHFGRTYDERARRFVRELDMTADEFIVKWFVRRKDHNRYYYPTDRDYSRSEPGVHNAGEPVPWNQQFMINDALQRLAECHALLGDDAARMALYDSCVRGSLTWFLGSLERHHVPAGDFCTWNYAPGTMSRIEDTVHAGIDVEGLCRCYRSGRYGDVLSPADMALFATDVVYVLPVGRNRWAGAVDGTSKAGHMAETDFPRPNLLLMLEFRPEAFQRFAEATAAAKRTGGDITAFTHLLWVRAHLDGAR